MILRRALGAGLVAVLAAGPALALPATPASAAVTAPAATKPGYVAVVISGHGTHCVKWKSGITGDTVLNDVATVAYRSDGLILQIDGDPSSGTADADHFWSYWHDTSGKKWAYSNYGASSFTPAAGSVEGWSYDNGKAHAPSPSQNPTGLYAKICGAKDKHGRTVVVPVTSSSAPTHPTATPATTTRPAHRSSPGRHRRTRSAQPAPTAAPATRSSAPSPRTSSPATATASAPPTSPPATRSSRPAAAGGGPGSGLSYSAPPATTKASPAPRTIDASPTASSSSSGSPVGLLVVLGLVVLLGAGAGALALRRRSAGG